MNPHQRMFNYIGRPKLDIHRLVIAYAVFALIFGILTPNNYAVEMLRDGSRQTSYGIASKWLTISERQSGVGQTEKHVVLFSAVNLAVSLAASGAFFTLLFAGWVFRYQLSPTSSRHQLQES